MYTNNNNIPNTNASTQNVDHDDDEADSKVKLAKLSDLKDMNLSGGSSQWLQAGIGSTNNMGYDSLRAADAEEAEEVAVLREMEAVLSSGLHRVLLLTDCHCLVRAFRECSEDLSWGALTLALDIREMAASFLDFRFEFCDRSCNFEAHFLAARGATNPPIFCNLPLEVENLVNSVSPPLAFRPFMLFSLCLKKKVVWGSEAVRIAAQQGSPDSA
ncbi:hypothetical protein GIB67_036495 [Kingdonia uniflora]|uniref:RNase H type-1 domain-containing protein n=1 Tax=Kingdonia uniflora TaxID=39325 RepID=A0A7J7P8C4_9MAGN|nr:hypothetical protein GIB67_036495 [Kingdonia uniflora]